MENRLPIAIALAVVWILLRFYMRYRSRQRRILLENRKKMTNDGMTNDE